MISGGALERYEEGDKQSTLTFNLTAETDGATVRWQGFN